MQSKQPIPLISAPSDESGSELIEKGKRKHKSRQKQQSLLSSMADYGLAIFFVLFLVGMVLVCVFFGPGAPPSNLKVITLDDLFDPTLKAKTPTVTWLKDGSNYAIFSQKNDIEATHGSDGAMVILADQSKAIDKDNNQLNFSAGFTFSYDEKYILIPVNVKMRWRHSFFANYLIWDVSSQTFKVLGQLQDPPVILNAQWSTTDHTIKVFVMNDDIYLTTAENPEKNIKITQDGILNIENGIMAWVYEEEIFSDFNAIWWRPANDDSPRPSQFVFFRSNNSQVPSFSYPIYQDVEDSSYTTIIDLKYPKSGYSNPVVSMVLYDIATNTSTTLPGLNDEYITDVTWFGSDLLACRTTNRLQNVETIFLYNIDEKGVVTLTKSFVTQSVENGWIVPRPYTLMFLNPTTFVFIRNNTDNYHLYLVDTSNVRFSSITTGSWDVTDLVGCNVKDGIVFYMCTLPDPTERHLYAVQISTNTKVKLTPANVPGYYSVNFNEGGTYYIQYYEGPKVPNSQVYQAPITIQPDSVPTKIRDLETNKALADKLVEYDIPTKTFLEIEISNGIKLNSWYLLPPSMSSSYYYPVLLDIYCGPNSQTVTKKWKLGFDEYVTSSLGIIVASVDCRGTGARGISFMQQVYTRLGSLESQDIIEVAKKLGDLTWMDSGRIGIWGWSYGGYMTLRTLIEDGGNVFKTGISVAPVTDWRLYDTFYTERFMKTPEDNVSGYNQSSILSHADGLGKVPFLLVHGTGDDNVHFQNTVLLNDKLVSLGTQYETMFYANRQHSINSKGSLKHLYKLISNFLIKNLSGLSEVRLRPTDN